MADPFSIDSQNPILHTTYIPQEDEDQVFEKASLPEGLNNLFCKELKKNIRLCPQSLHHMMIEANKSAPLNIQTVLS